MRAVTRSNLRRGFLLGSASLVALVATVAPAGCGSSGSGGAQTDGGGSSVSDSAADSTSPDASANGDASPDASLDAGCDGASCYPAAKGCPPGIFAWACFPPSPTLTPATLTRVTLSGDDVIVDARTHLMWAAKEEPPATWAAAVSACTNSRRAGFADWRLPSRIELVSLIDYTKASEPSIDTTQFFSADGGTATNDAVWTSSLVASAPGPAGGQGWAVYFNGGGVDWDATVNPQGVRCVR
jgi:hypothetical protein